MIDTDKYEGHTRGPWNADDDGAGGNLHVDAGDVRLPVNWADTQLMADAPLLLEEVERLQIYERIVLCIALHQQLPDGLHVDEELMLRAREHLRKNGEWEGEEE